MQSGWDRTVSSYIDIPEGVVQTLSVIVPRLQICDVAFDQLFLLVSRTALILMDHNLMGSGLEKRPIVDA